MRLSAPNCVGFFICFIFEIQIKLFSPPSPLFVVVRVVVDRWVCFCRLIRRASQHSRKLYFRCRFFQRLWNVYYGVPSTNEVNDAAATVVLNKCVANSVHLFILTGWIELRVYILLQLFVQLSWDIASCCLIWAVLNWFVASVSSKTH